jgi:GPH family glycoside/pentoside/hexuronide:cation symporter
MKASIAADQIEEFPRVLKLREKIAYGMGDVGNNFLFDMGQLYLLKYFTDSVGLSPAVGGGVFLVAKFWDAFADVAVGTAIDHRKKIGKRGKFRPFILWAALPLAILSIANFSMPDFSVTLKEVWAYVAYILFGTVYSISNIAYGSMQPAMTKNSVERSELASYRNIGANIGQLISTAAFMPIVLMLPTDRIGYMVAITIFSAAGVACQLFTYFNIKENYVEKKNSNEGKVNIKEILKSYKAVFKNGPLLILCLANLFTFSAFNVIQAVQFYFAQYALHNIKIVSYMSLLTVGGGIVGSALVPTVTKKIGKKYTYMIGCFIWFIADLLGFFLTNSGWSFAFFTTIAYFGNGLLSALNWALISDVVEYGEWKTHVRSEGIVYSSYTFFRKLSQAAAGLIPGVVLTFVGYVPNQAQTATSLLGIRSLVFLYPVIMAILTVILMFFYPLNENRYAQIMDDLSTRRHGAKVETDE